MIGAVSPGGSGRIDQGPAFLDRERTLADTALADVAADALLEVPPALRAPVEYALSTSGKRLRPVLCAMAYGAATKQADLPAVVYRLSAALEIVHTYSLIHDDLPCMDDDTLRRGRPTLHVVHGVRTAIVAGAVLLPIAIRVLDAQGAALGLTVEQRAALVTELAEAAGAEGMVGGQLLDLEAERRPVDGFELEDIHRRKTGALLTSSLRIGALAGGAQRDLLDALTRYGRALGLAFQIADDLLDVEGSSSDIGKTAGRDFDLEKASYPAIHGVEGARRLARARVLEAKDAIAPFQLDRFAALADYVIERRH